VDAVAQPDEMITKALKAFSGGGFGVHGASLPWRERHATILQP
jgi:hypothetical protein